MTDNTEPTIDEYLDRISELNKLGYPDLDGACNICGVHPDALKALIANQVREAKGDLIETICDIEATREAEGKDFISYKAFKRIKSLAGLDNG